MELVSGIIIPISYIMLNIKNGIRSSIIIQSSNSMPNSICQMVVKSNSILYHQHGSDVVVSKLRFQGKDYPRKCNCWMAF